MKGGAQDNRHSSTRSSENVVHAPGWGVVCLAEAARCSMLPTMSITAIVQNDTVKLPVHVPDGTRVEITVPEDTRVPTMQRSVFERLQALSVNDPDSPTDLATNPAHMEGFGASHSA